MTNPWDQMRETLQAAKDANRAADEAAQALASILDGRLRHVSRWTLKRLKRQLQDFDAAKLCWKDER